MIIVLVYLQVLTVCLSLPLSMNALSKSNGTDFFLWAGVATAAVIGLLKTLPHFWGIA